MKSCASKCERDGSRLPAVWRMQRSPPARHVAYGARPEHYPVVGEVLIASMAEIAGPAWRPEYERGWNAAFRVVAGAMLERGHAATQDPRNGAEPAAV
jgi:hemoglobin-like flavoprotein